MLNTLKILLLLFASGDILFAGDNLDNAHDEITLSFDHMITAGVIRNYLIDFTNQDQKSFGAHGFHQLPPQDFLPNEQKFHEFLSKTVNKLAQKVEVKNAFIDFDGVLASTVLVNSTTNEKFFHLLNTTNVLLSKQINNACATFANEFAEKYASIKEKLVPKNYAANNVFNTDIILEFLYFLHASLRNSYTNKFEGFGLEYQVICEQMGTFLEELRKDGFSFQVLSAREASDAKLSFLERSYPDIFLKNSYIYSPQKHEVIAKAGLSCLEQSCLTIFLDDHAVAMLDYRYAANELLTKQAVPSKEHNYLFVPYLTYAHHFNEREFIDEIIRFIDSIGEGLIDKFQEHYFKKR